MNHNEDSKVLGGGCYSGETGGNGAAGCNVSPSFDKVEQARSLGPTQGKPHFYADPVIGIGGAPTRNTTMPQDAAGRKQFPVASGCMDYFPDAIAAVSHLSYKGNEQHNPGQPLHWARGKSADEADTLMRHFLQRGTLDSDGIRHSVKVAWRALAMLQKEIEEESISVQQHRKAAEAREYHDKLQAERIRQEHRAFVRQQFDGTDPNTLNDIIRDAKASLDRRGMLCATDLRNINKESDRADRI